MRKFGFAVALLLVFGTTFAASWPSSGPARKVVTLVVCSNNKSPRLLAEVIQVESKQPYLLLPAPQSNDDRIFFIRSKGAALQIRESRLDSFILFLNPSRIVVLGDETYVSDRYLKKIGKNIPVFIVKGNDWGRIADELTYMLNISGLGKDFRRLHHQMLTDSAGIYKPVSKPAKPTPVQETAPAAEAAPAVEEAPAINEAPAAVAPVTDAPATDAAAAAPSADDEK